MTAKNMMNLTAPLRYGTHRLADVPWIFDGCAGCWKVVFDGIVNCSRNIPDSASPRLGLWLRHGNLRSLFSTASVLGYRSLTVVHRSSTYRTLVIDSRRWMLADCN